MSSSTAHERADESAFHAELAVECGRSHIELADVVFALCEDRNAIPLLAELGIQIERVPELLERHRATRPPPDVGESN